MSTNTQKLFCAITGYDVKGITGARDDYYFEAKTTEDRLQQLRMFADNVLEVPMSEQEISHVDHAIQAKKEGSDDWYKVYDALTLTPEKCTSI